MVWVTCLDGAPHLHILIRGTVAREIIRQVTAATYHQVWWPPHDRADIRGFVPGQKANRAVGYATKYLTKSIAEVLDTNSDRTRTDLPAGHRRRATTYR